MFNYINYLIILKFSNDKLLIKIVEFIFLKLKLFIKIKNKLS